MEIQHVNEYDFLPAEVEKALKALLAEGREAEYLSLVEGVQGAFKAAQEEIRVRMAARGGIPPTCNSTGFMN